MPPNFHFASGWRNNEIVSLEWKHVGEDTIRLAAENSKNDEPRNFPLIGTVADIVARRAAKRTPVCANVFCQGGRPITDMTWRKHWRRAAVKAGLGSFDAKGKYRGVNPHDCRRAFITDAVNAGIDSQTARTLSGHKCRAVFDRYRIVTNDVLRQAIERREAYVAERAADSKVVVLADRRFGQLSDDSRRTSEKS